MFGLRHLVLDQMEEWTEGIPKLEKPSFYNASAIQEAPFQCLKQTCEKNTKSSNL